MLDAHLGARAQDATALTHTGLRMDQAAMIYEALTSTRRVSVGVGPAGSGKTHTAAAGARAWEANGGEVIGLTCAQAASNVLHAAGIRESYNTSRFLRQIDDGMVIRPVVVLVMVMTAERMAHSTRNGGPQDGMILTDTRPEGLCRFVEFTGLCSRPWAEWG